MPEIGSSIGSQFRPIDLAIEIDTATDFHRTPFHFRKMAVARGIDRQPRRQGFTFRIGR